MERGRSIIFLFSFSNQIDYDATIEDLSSKMELVDNDELKQVNQTT
jgi:hypothetical protein